MRANDVAPLQGAVIYPLITGGLRFASTTGYYLAAFQAAIKHFAVNAAKERLELNGRRMTFQFAKPETVSKAELYANLQSQLRSLLDGERDFIANAANFSALLYHSLSDLNWAGFYLQRDGELVLGPFQGKPACVRIAIGKGVCGTAAEQRQTILVDNVHEFPGHIACDSASNSEIVVPIVKHEQLIGVLDLDSPSFARFDDQDAKGLNDLAEMFIDSSSLEFKL